MVVTRSPIERVHPSFSKLLTEQQKRTKLTRVAITCLIAERIKRGDQKIRILKKSKKKDRGGIFDVDFRF